MTEVIIGVYVITNAVNGKRYIGSSGDVACRLRHHKRDLRLNLHGNRHLQSAWNKYGAANFTYEVLETVGDVHDLREREQYHLDQYYPHTYNKRDITEATHADLKRGPMPLAVRMKIGAAHLGKRGLKHTQQARENMGASKRGRKLSPERCAAISLARKAAWERMREWPTERFQAMQSKMSEAAKRRGRNWCKLTDDNVAEIRDLRACGFKLRELAELFKVSTDTVWGITSGRMRA